MPPAAVTPFPDDISHLYFTTQMTVKYSTGMCYPTTKEGLRERRGTYNMSVLIMIQLSWSFEGLCHIKNEILILIWFCSNFGPKGVN